MANPPTGVGRVPIAAAAIDAPWGPMHLAASDAGVVAVENLTPWEPFVEGLERRFRTSVERVRHPVLDQALTELAAWLDGRRRAFDVPIDLSDRPDWDQRVLRAVAGIPWGQTASYAEIARRVGMPGAARAVGGAVGRSPIGIVVPCHRVIGADGTLRGYGGGWFGSLEAGLDLKHDLLLREGLDIPRTAPPTDQRSRRRLHSLDRGRADEEGAE
jgi:O-6-methylguanine DNA methyltransferase